MVLLNEKSQPQKKKTVFCREEKDGIFLMIGKGSKTTEPKMFFISEKEAIVWRHCDGKKSVKEIIGILCKKYSNFSKKEISLAVNKFLLQVYNNGLIVLV